MNELEKLLSDNVIKIESNKECRLIDGGILYEYGVIYDVSDCFSEKPIIEIVWCKTKKERNKLYNEIKKEITEKWHKYYD